MRVLRWVLLASAPALLMAYGWYLGQLHQSGTDVAGIFLFLTGAAGLALALLARLALRRYAWMQSWWANLLAGVLSCGVIVGIVLTIVRIF